MTKKKCAPMDNPFIQRCILHFPRIYETCELKKKALKIINDFENPCPKDIFKWNNKNQAEITKGRFNKFCFELVETLRKEFREQIEAL